MTLVVENTYGTLPASGFTRMLFATSGLGAEQPLLNSELLGYGRDPLSPIKDAGTVDGNVMSSEITYASNLDRIETIRADGKIDGADPSIAALTGRVDVRFADQTLVNRAIDRTARALSFAYTLPLGESLRLTAHAVYLPRPRL